MIVTGGEGEEEEKVNLKICLAGELGTVEELFAYFFGIYIKFDYKNPPILTPSHSVDVAT